jgi:hypothetical protein
MLRSEKAGLHFKNRSLSKRGGERAAYLVISLQRNKSEVLIPQQNPVAFGTDCSGISRPA